MIAKYAGTCNRCKVRIEVGEQISWSRKHRGVVYHITCPDGSKPAMVDVDAGDTRDDNSNHDETTSDYTRDYAKENGYAYESDSLYRSDMNGIQDVYKKADAEYERNQLERNNGNDRGTPRTPITPTANSSLAAMLATAIQEYLPGTPIDDNAVREIFKQETASLSGNLVSLIAEEVAKISAPAVTVTVQNLTTGETTDVGVQHKQFPLLLTVVSTGLNVWLAGPSGSGKTQAAQNVATALGLKFYFCGAQSNEYGLSGFTDANGKTTRTLFREAYEHGGMFLFDEVDASNANALLWLNAALSNGHCAFPDAVVPKHPDCIVIAAANTWGFGATNDYVGRVKMDAAFLKRFVPIAWDYDEQLETTISGNAAWAKRVQSVRARVRSQAIKAIVSPRETLYGSKLLAAGIAQNDVEIMLLKAGMTDTQWESVR